MAYKRRRTVRKRNRRKTRKAPLMKIGRGMAQSTFAMTKTYTTAIIGGGASSLDYSNNVSIANVTGFANLAAVFNQYRINYVVVTFQSPYDGSPHMQLRYKPKYLSNESVPSSANAWGEIRHKKNIFSVRKQFTISCGFKPHTWVRQEIVPGSSNMRDRPQFGAWYTCPTDAAYAMQYSGIIAQLTNLDGSTISSSDVFQVTTKLYIQFKGKAVPT